MYTNIKIWTLILLFPYFLFAQRANTWMFGNGAGLSFNSPPPTSLNGGQTIAPDNTSSISDLQGNLLFYTNGVTVWNKNHVVMPNGSGLIGHPSAGQCAVIVPYPCHPDKYIVFHVTEYSNPGNLNYSVVDMTLSGGLGDVISTQKNISLGTGWTEKLCAYYNPSGNFYWLFTHKWNSNQFVGFKVSGGSIATQSVVSSVGSILNCGSYGGIHDAMGQLTISPDGSKIVNSLTCQNSFEVFDLNIATGIVSNPKALPATSSPWGAAFSPDSKKLYVDGLSSQNIYQYDLTSGNQATIISSQYIVYSAASSGYNFGYMEMGPDSLVYIAKPGSSNLIAISNPNIVGSGCNFSLLGPSLGSHTSSHGLSRIAYNISSSTLSSTLSSIAACNNASVQLTPTVTGGAAPYSYTWTPGNYNTSIINITPTVSSVYSVTIQDNNGCTGTATAAVNVATISSNFNYNLNPCNGAVTTINNSTGASSSSWDFGDGTTSSLNQPTHSYSTAGNYTITLISTNSSGCTDTIKKGIIISPPVQSIFNAQLNVCDSTVNLVNSSNGASSYAWNFGDGSTSTLQNPNTHTYHSGGNYIISLVVTSGNGCKDSTQKSVTIIKNSVADFNFSTSGCSSQVTFTNTSSIAATYDWQFGDGSTSAIANPVHSYSGSGTFPVTLILNAGTGCSATITKTVTVGNGPQANFIFSVSVCSSIVSFTNTTTLNISSTWYFGDGSSSYVNSPSHAFPGNGTYQVSLVVGANSICADTLLQTVVLNNTLVVADFNYTNPETTYNADFINLSQNASTYYWDFGDGFTSNVFEPAHSFPTAGRYPVCLVASNSLGCADTICKNVDIDPGWTFYVPNTFSPDGNGINEIFYAYGTNISHFKIRIFDRWGEQLFYSGDLHNGWDGIYKGVEVKPDIYVWKAEFNDYKGKFHGLTGHIQVLK